MPSGTLYNKINGSYTAAHKAYVKTNGAWVEQTSVQSTFRNDKSYIDGDWWLNLRDNNGDPITDNTGADIEVTT